MVGQISYYLDEILDEKQLDHVIAKSIAGSKEHRLIDYELKPAAEGLSGFVGVHLRAVLRVKVDDKLETVHLFIKKIPTENKPKMDFIVENKFFTREMTVFKLIEDFNADTGTNPCVSRAYIYTETILVMPDLCHQGYSTCNYLEPLDLPHILVTTASIARFHASCANYETMRTLNECRPYQILDEYSDVFFETTYQDSPWMRAAAKLTANLLKEFSPKFSIENLELILIKTYVAACDTLKEYEGDLNVIVHKDLWVNNILFKYKDGLPVNSLIIDFQCTRYGPPTFDLMAFLYLTSSRNFRRDYEDRVFDFYFKTFMETLDNATKLRLKEIGYDKVSFLGWCERSRMFGALQAIANFPYTLMEPVAAQKIFDDPDTYIKYLNEDRSEPVINHAKGCKPYRERQVEVSEEFVERYILHKCICP